MGRRTVLVVVVRVAIPVFGVALLLELEISLRVLELRESLPRATSVEMENPGGMCGKVGNGASKEH